MKRRTIRMKGTDMDVILQEAPVCSCIRTAGRVQSSTEKGRVRSGRRYQQNGLDGIRTESGDMFYYEFDSENEFWHESAVQLIDQSTICSLSGLPEQRGGKV